MAVIFLFVSVVFLLRKVNKNKKNRVSNLLLPFNAKLDPPGGNRDPSKGKSLLRTTGVPQITCPAGSKVNIVGAWIEVYDPYAECSSAGAIPTFLNTCGLPITDPSTQTVCSTSSDCATGQACANNVCVPNSCKVDSDCASSSVAACPSGKTTFTGDDGPCMACNNGFCVQKPTCQNINNRGQNLTCLSGNCRKRDASAWLAAKCDGKQSCMTDKDPWIPSDPTSGFGPLPCDIAVPNSVGAAGSAYALLPIIPGWDAKQKDTAGDTHQNSFSQGYYVHGLYSCVPDDE